MSCKGDRMDAVRVQVKRRMYAHRIRSHDQRPGTLTARQSHVGLRRLCNVKAIQISLEYRPALMVTGVKEREGVGDR